MRPRTKRTAPAKLARAALFALALPACPSRPGPGRADAGTGAVHANAGATADAGQDPCASLTAEQRGLVVARVGDSTLTLCDFAKRINLQNQYLRARFAAPEQRRALLDAWVDSELMATEARARGLDQQPAVRHAVTSQLARELENQLRAAVPAPDLTEADVERYYNEHASEYDTPRQVRASQIVLASRAQAERVLADARAHASDDAYFRELARRETVDGATRDIGGDLGFFAADGGNLVPPEVARAAFGLHSSGEIAPEVVESAHGGPNHGPGFHVVRLTATRDALHRSLDEVRRQIRSRLFRERTDAAQQAAVQSVVTRLRTEAHVTVDEAALGQVHLDIPAGTPPALRGTGPGQPPVPPGFGPAAGAPEPR